MNQSIYQYSNTFESLVIPPIGILGVDILEDVAEIDGVQDETAGRSRCMSCVEGSMQ